MLYKGCYASLMYSACDVTATTQDVGMHHLHKSMLLQNE